MKHSNTLVVAAVIVASGFSFSSASGQELFRANVETIQVTTNSTGSLSYKLYGNHQIIAAAAADAGLTNLSGLRLVYNKTGDDLEVVSGTNNTVIATPFTFTSSVSLSKTNNTVLERLAWIFLGTNTQASGTLRDTEFSFFGTNDQLTAFTLRGQLQFATPASGTNPAAVYSGSLSAGSFYFQEGDFGGQHTNFGGREGGGD